MSHKGLICLFLFFSFGLDVHAGHFGAWQAQKELIVLSGRAEAWVIDYKTPICGRGDDPGAAAPGLFAFVAGGEYGGGG